jgi:outer membrane protein OmpA-like peptidoglycan-associated protein
LKKLLPYLLVTVISVQGLCQSTNITTFLQPNKLKADNFYFKKAYRNALEIYLRIADKNAADTYCKQQIADCYMQLNDPIAAELWYSSALQDPDVLPAIRLKYARTLCMNKKYTEALTVLKSIDKSKTDSLLIKQQISFIENIDYYMRDSLLYTLAVAQPLNSVHSDFGATYFKDNVVFASTRDYDLFIKHKSLAAPTSQESPTNLYVASQSITGDFGKVSLFKRDALKTPFHDGPIEFYKNYTKAAFTQSNVINRNGVEDANGSVNLKLYLADVGALGGLNNITPFPLNSDGYSVGHATFTHNGNRIYFASTMPMGLGGSDIYYSSLVNGSWSDPVNAGPAINTSGDELYPHLENDSTLTYASTGHGGFGGLDIFMSKIKNGKFRYSQNLGYPVNSPYDDFSLTTDSTGRVGFFSSNRPGGLGADDIYRFIATKIFLQGETRDRDNLSAIVPFTKVILKDESGTVIDSTTSDAQGNFKLDLPFDRDMIITAEKEGYDILEDIGFSSRGLSFGIDSLLLPLWKHALFAKGRIFSNETQSILPGATVIRKDLNTGETDTVVVSENGEYGFLVLPNHKYRIEAMKEGFITNGFDLNTKDLYKGDLLNDIVLEEIYIEKATPLFDLNKSNIRPEAFKSLDRIVRTLKKYGTTTLNIGAHADSRGSKEYNKRLSTKRAATVVQYFVDRGIARSRIYSQAFGEELILNHCSDGVICTEDDHSQNRRVEIKVQNKPIE